jgi:hypothetical protein
VVGQLERRLDDLLTGHGAPRPAPTERLDGPTHEA